jgi:hypothetical protein
MLPEKSGLPARNANAIKTVILRYHGLLPKSISQISALRSLPKL